MRRSTLSKRPTDHVVSQTADTVVVLGEFDGVHRDHVALVEAALQHAEPLSAAVVAVVVDRGEGVERIMSVSRRCELLLSCGVSSAFVAPLPRPVDVEDTLAPALEVMRPVAVFLDPESWPSQPRNALSEYFLRIGAAIRDGVAGSDQTLGPIDTAMIIERIHHGDVDAAGKMLGRPYELSGTIAAHDAIAPPTGFQTEQVTPPPDIVLPASGVYAARTLIGRRWVGAAVNIGSRPTFGSSNRVVVESHLIDFGGNLKDTEMSLRFVRRLRNQLWFPGPDELAAQIERDVVAVTALLRSKA